jgi:hypothetical protein
MGKRFNEDIRRNMDAKSTEELAMIYSEYNLNEWSEEAFDVVGSILTERGENISALAGSRKAYKSKTDKPEEKIKGKQSPESIITQAIFGVYWAGVGSIIWAVILAFKAVGPASRNDVVINLAIGTVFIILGGFVRKRNRIALLIAMIMLAVIVALNAVAGIKIILSGGVPLGLGGLVLGVGIFIWMFRGYSELGLIEGEKSNKEEIEQKRHNSKGIILSPSPAEIPILKLPDVYEAALGEAIKNNPQRNPIPYAEDNVKVRCPQCGVDYNANGFQIGFFSSLISNAKERIPMSFASGDKGIYPRCMKGVCPNQSCSCRTVIIRWLG